MHAPETPKTAFVASGSASFGTKVTSGIGMRRVQIRQLAMGRFCVFTDAGQVAAIEPGQDGTHRIERYGDQPFTAQELAGLAQAVREAEGGLALGATRSFMLGPEGWVIER